MIDVYWYCPKTVDAANHTLIDTEGLYNALKGAGLGDVCIEWFDYDPVQFYDKALALGFAAADSFKERHAPSRKLSQLHNISKSVELAHKTSIANGINYDIAIVTRFDFIPMVVYNLPSVLKEGIHLYRPYSSCGVPCSEDRAFYGSPEYIFKLRDYYNKIDTNFTNTNLNHEALLTRFCMSAIDTTKLYVIENMDIPIMITEENILAIARVEEESYMRANSCKQTKYCF